MPNENINGISIYLEEYGSGEPLVLVHGSWASGMDWAFVVPLVASKYHVMAYDRRGHSQSERPPGQGSVHEDVADLAAVIERAGGPAHIVANSFGAVISLRLLWERPELVRTLSGHEPPFFNLLAEDAEHRTMFEEVMERSGGVANEIVSGNMEEGARRFVDTVALGPGSWDSVVPEPVKQTLIANAPTFLDEMRDPDALSIDLEALASVDKPVFLTRGTESPPIFGAVLDRIEEGVPQAKSKTFEGAGHVPHLTHAQEYAAAVMEFIAANGSA